MVYSRHNAEALMEYTGTRHLFTCMELRRVKSAFSDHETEIGNGRNEEVRGMRVNLQLF